MPSEHIPRPLPSEIPSYYRAYLACVPDGDILATLERNLVATLDLLAEFGEVGAQYRYAPDKWSVKEVVGHMIDTERIFATRILCFSRGESAALPGYDQDAYAGAARFDARTLQDLTEEMRYLRAANLALFRSFDNEALGRRGIADGQELSVTHIMWIICGHEIHHTKVLRERYSGAFESP